MPLARHLCLLLCMGVANGFRPNHESGDIAPSDFTDADITEIGVLRAVAWYLERNPLPGKPPMSPGQLENMVPLNATGLFKAYFQADISPSRLIKAIQEIVNGNNQVERYHKHDSSFFFYCEEIPKSIKQLQNLQESVLSAMKGTVNSSGLASARLSAGMALHVQQKFYSNTNWVEMRKGETYRHLLSPTSPAFPVAPASMETCRDCIPEPRNQYRCEENILVNGLLTSGYKVSSTCRMKQRGKCGHGGRDDVTQSFPPTGGINKETSNPLLSPHYYFHQQAAELAIQATRDFFVGDGPSLINQIGHDTFKAFLNLEGYSLTFVIDTTGSMSEEIQQVKTTCIKMLQNYFGSPDAPFNYIVVPFNDPAVGPVFQTDKVDEMEAFISSLRVSGGGDCPEMSMTGLKLALQESLPRSKIFTFTDADAKDESLLDEIKALIDSSQSEVNYFLTGSCSSRKRRSTEEEFEASERSYANVYEEIAAHSDGFCVRTSKRELSQMLPLMETSLNSAPVKVARGHMEGTHFHFAVESSLVNLLVSVARPNYGIITSITLKLPSGEHLTSAQMLVDTDTHKLLKVPSIEEYGLWTLIVSPGGSAEVEVRGKSLLDFSYQIMEEQEGYVLPVQGRPVKGENYTVSLKLMGDTGGVQLKRLVVLSSQGTPIDSVDLNQSMDALGNLFATAFLPLRASDSMLSLEGVSSSHLPFTRISSSHIITESVKIVLLPDQSSTMSPGETLDISVLVMNDGAASSFTFKIWDDLGLMRTFSPEESFIDSGENVTVTATFAAAAESDSFASSIATFMAKGSAAQNYLKLPITVIPQAALVSNPPYAGFIPRGYSQLTFSEEFCTRPNSGNPPAIAM
ncbi:von Willebrand factor A domain-containing protein 7 [Varanus komodoensis]|nr:von Willebrand factor A domain-containing protein 7 [Varanus komodoensis]